MAWRAVNAYGIRIGYRTYDCPDLGPLRRQRSGVTAKRGLWEMHYDPYDLSQIFVRTSDGWITVPWTQLPLISAPFADFTWHHARRLAAQVGLDDTDEKQVARVLDRLLTRAEHGPDRRTAKVMGRTRAAGPALGPESEPAVATAVDGEPTRTPKPASNVVPFGAFDAHAEAERWL